MAVRHVRVILPKNSRSSRSLLLDMNALLLDNCAVDASQLCLQLKDVYLTSGDSADTQRPLLQLTSASLLMAIKETLDVKITVAPIQGQLDTAQYVCGHSLVVHVSGPKTNFHISN